MGLISLLIRFDKINGLIGVYDGIRYLVSLGRSWYDEICDKIKYLISEKKSLQKVINHNFVRIRIDSYNYLAIEKILTFHNVLILIDSVLNNNESNYYYNVVLEKGSYKDKSNI